MIRGFALFVGKILAALAFSTAFLSNFTSCVMFVHQPQMPEKVRMMKN